MFCLVVGSALIAFFSCEEDARIEQERYLVEFGCVADVLPASVVTGEPELATCA